MCANHVRHVESEGIKQGAIQQKFRPIACHCEKHAKSRDFRYDRMPPVEGPPPPPGEGASAETSGLVMALHRRLSKRVRNPHIRPHVGVIGIRNQLPEALAHQRKWPQPAGAGTRALWYKVVATLSCVTTFYESTCRSLRPQSTSDCQGQHACPLDANSTQLARTCPALRKPLSSNSALESHLAAIADWSPRGCGRLHSLGQIGRSWRNVF